MAVAGGTDKMGAYTALGWLRTYARLDPNQPFTYDAWAEAVRAGRTISTTGPLIDLSVEGREIGDTIDMPPTGGTLELHDTFPVACGGATVYLNTRHQAVPCGRGDSFDLREGRKNTALWQKSKFQSSNDKWNPKPTCYKRLIFSALASV